MRDEGYHPLSRRIRARARDRGWKGRLITGDDARRPLGDELLTSREELAHQVLAAIGAGRLAVVSGPSGSGRTTVLARVATLHDGPTLAGGGLAGLRHEPGLAISRALRLPVPPDDAARAAEFVLAAAGRRALLVIDDLHLCDLHTIEVITLLVGQLALLVSVADDGPHGRGLASELTVSTRASRFPMAPLADQEASELARQGIGGGTDALVGSVVRRAAGNPRLICALAQDPSGHDLRTSIANRLARVEAGERSLLCLIGLLGRPVDVSLLPPPLVDAATRAMSLVVSDGEIRARSGLDVEVALAVLSDGGRRDLHALLARRLPHPGERARHLEAAGDDAAAEIAARTAVGQATSTGERLRYAAIVARTSPPEDRASRCLDVALQASDHGDHRLAAELLRASGAPPDRRADVIEGRVALASGDASAALTVLARSAGPPDRTDPDLEMLVELERARAWCLLDPQRALPVARSAHASARTEREEARAAGLLGAALLALGDDQWQPTLERCEVLARRAGLDDVAYAAAANRCSGLLRAGRPDDASAAAATNLVLATEARATTWVHRFEVLSLWVTVHAHGALGRARHDGEALLDRPMSAALRKDVVAMVALSCADHGELARAQTLLDGDADPGHDLVAWCAAELDLMAGNRAAARRRAVPLTARAGRWPVRALAAVTAVRSGASVDPIGVGPDDGASCEIAGLAAMSTDPAMAETLLAEAAHRWAGRSFRSRMRCELDAATLLGSTDAEHGLHRLRELAEELDPHQHVVLARQVDQARRRLGDPGVAVSVLGQQRQGLSRREVEVMDGVAAGLTSAAIAGQLGVAPSTVETHVRSAMGKLGASTRTEAAVLAAT